MTRTRKCNIKDLLPCQEGKSCQGRLADHRKNGEGKGVRAQPGGRGIQKPLGSAQGADGVPGHGGTNITQIEPRILLQHPCPTQKQRENQQPQRAISLPSRAEAGKTAKVSLSVFLKAR